MASAAKPIRQVEAPPITPWYWEGEKPPIAVSWLVKDFFPKKSVGLIVGESQAGKTFLGLDLAVAVATGRPFFGKSVSKGGVLYIAAEGQLTIPGRLWAARQGAPATEKMIAVMDEPPDLMNATGAEIVIGEARRIAQMKQEDAGAEFKLVIIDTLISSFTINNWNDAAETARAIKIMNLIRKETGATVIGIHHHGKDTSRGASGSHALTGGPDAILSVFRKVNKDFLVTGRHITLTKSRFGDTGRKYRFKLDTLPPDQRDEEGDGQAFIVPLFGSIADFEETASKPKAAGAAFDSFQSAFQTALKKDGVDRDHPDDGPVKAVMLSVVRECFSKLYKPKGSSADATRKAWDRALKIIGEGPLKCGEWGGQKWLYKQLDTDDADS